MNKTILMGRLTKDPETRHTQTNNTQVTSFTLAVNRRFSKEGQPSADFINIIAWNKTAEFVSKYFKKGQQVGVIGRIQTRNYDDEQGQKHYVTEVVAEEVYFADTKKEEVINTPIRNEGETTDVSEFLNTQTNSANSEENLYAINSEDDLPF